MGYKCATCSKSFTTKLALLSHWEAKQHFPDNSNNYCYPCDRRFTSKIGLEQHLRNSQIHQTNYRCGVCKRSFHSEWSLSQHDKLYCHQCERPFQDGNAREQHYRDAAVHRNKYCSSCQCIFDDEDERKLHDETYHEYDQWFYDDEYEENMHDSAYWDGYYGTQNGAKVDEELARQIAIEESRRKLAELEADKPLWEAAAKRRSMREEMESGGIRVKATTISQAEKEREEAERKARILREAEERRKEDERRQREAAARRERERQKQRWACGIWTTERTLERYKVMSDEFDSAKFSDDLPLIMEAVPWPVLTFPARSNIADVNWDAVEEFFTSVEYLMRPREYKVLVEKSHRRFHPDRWQGRNLWKNVVDEAERDDMKAAVNAVAQALTPIWRAATGR